MRGRRSTSNVEVLAVPDDLYREARARTPFEAAVEAERAVLEIANWADAAERNGEAPFDELRRLIARAIANLESVVERSK